MKENITIQLHHGEKELTILKNEAKQMWKDAGNLVKDIKSLNFYIKPHENKCYFSINEDFNESIDLV